MEGISEAMAVERALAREVADTKGVDEEGELVVSAGNRVTHPHKVSPHSHHGLNFNIAS